MVAGFLTQREEILQRLQLTLIEQMSDARIKEQLQALFGETARWLRVPTSMAAAGGIALINSIGNLGGYVGPFLVGWIKDSTKSFEMGVYVLAACAFTSALITYFAQRATGAKSATG